MSTVCVFLFMYVEVPVRWVGIVRQKPFQPCDTTRSGSYKITGLVSHISNEYNISKPILDQKKKKMNVLTDVKLSGLLSLAELQVSMPGVFAQTLLSLGVKA